MASPQATEAAARKRRERVAALGAVTLPEAAAVVGVGEDSLRRWVADGHGKTAFRGPKGTGRPWLFRLDELRAELEAWRCTWEDGCPEFALLSTSSPRRCKRHAPDVDRRGGVTATELARELGVDPVDLLERAKKGEKGEKGGIPAERVDRGGRPAAYRLDRDEALAVIERDFLCQWRGGCGARDGRPGYALGESRHCREHAAGAASIARAAGKVRVTCPGPECGDVREDYPSQVRAGELCTHCNPRHEAHAALREARDELIARKAAKGIVPQQEIAELFCVAPSTSLSGRLATGEVHIERGLGLVLVDKAHADRYRLKRIRTDGRARAALELDVVMGRLDEAGIIRTRKHETDLRRRFRAKARWKQRLSPGRPRTIAAHWLELGDLVITHRRNHQLSLELDAVLEGIWQLDWAERPEAWSRDRYPPEPHDPRFPARAGRWRAIDRLKKRIGADVAQLLAGVST